MWSTSYVMSHARTFSREIPTLSNELRIHFLHEIGES